MAEIDLKATAAARKASRPAGAVRRRFAQTPAEAARTGREGPKAKVRLTDADVSHETVLAAGGHREARRRTTPQGRRSPGRGRLRPVQGGSEPASCAGRCATSAGPRPTTRACPSRPWTRTARRSGRARPRCRREVSIRSRRSRSRPPIPVGDKIVAGLPIPAAVARRAAAGLSRGGGRRAARLREQPGQPPARRPRRPSQPPAPTPTPYGQGAALRGRPFRPPRGAARGRTGPATSRAPSDPASQPKPPQSVSGKRTGVRRSPDRLRLPSRFPTIL